MTAQALYGIIHWVCLRCWRKWTTEYEVMSAPAKEEDMTLEHCCEVCAGKTYSEITRLRKKHKKEHR